jgi:hypothetical protein
MNTNKKKILVAWSGGIDSTYLIHKLLNDGYSVAAIHCVMNSGSTQSMRESAAIKKMVEYFSAYDFQYIGESTTSPSGCYNPGIALLQSIPILTTLLYGCDQSHESVAIGYVMGDDAISYLSELKTIWKTFSLNMLEGHKLPELLFPLSKIHKTVIYNELPDGLKKSVVFCESPAMIDIPCGICDSCKKMSMYGLLSDIQSVQRISVLDQHRV